jgi:hypothetical protein
MNEIRTRDWIAIEMQANEIRKSSTTKKTGWFSGPDTIGYLNQHVYASLNIHLWSVHCWILLFFSSNFLRNGK